MDTKVVAIAAIVGIVVIAGAAYFILSGEDGVEEVDVGDNSLKVDFKFDNKVRLAIGGNANGDDYIDEKDISVLEDLILEKKTYEPGINSFADANNDGVLDNKDIEIVKKIIAGEPCKMYYWSAAKMIESINYPLSGKIAAAHNASLDMTVLLGIYKDVVGVPHGIYADANKANLDRYPGMGTKIKDIGNPWENCEEAVKQGINVMVDQSSGNDYSTWTKVANSAGLDFQFVRLFISKYNVDAVDIRGTVLILGEMFQVSKQAHKYVDWVDGVSEYITKQSKGINKDWTYINPLPSDKPSEIYLDSVAPNGDMWGDVYTVSLTGMKSVNTVGYGCPQISLEEVYNIDPDVIIISLTGTSGLSVPEVQEKFNHYADIYKETNAYKNGNVYGVAYFTISNTAGPSELVLLASYIWPDLFDEEVGKEYIKYYYDNFSNYSGMDVLSIGDFVPYKLPSKA